MKIFYRRKNQIRFDKSLNSVLIVADPQIQGFRDEPPGILGLITRWDSDQYLSRGFSWAKKAVKQNLTIFLGDLIDEGYSASDSDYKIYVKRFKKIFPVPDSKALYLPGDNDIGGEGSERVTE